ncbi:hypothetical protein F4X86_01985 [Candidatus Saccharibacteria bacterium]|nr:hypothetical protein [Candidatus Saccharibacteria bacterium]
MKDIDTYQQMSADSRLYKGEIKHAVVYPAFGLAGEVGEFHDKLKKIFRDKRGRISDDDRRDLELELGDIVWYVAVCAEVLGLKMSDILEANLRKCAGRRQRGTVGGSGDDR